jgi:AcrR family transcriptional regulator
MTYRYRHQIIEAAMAAFMRYGYRRVTMSDLAKEAGISRPTLYSVFASKEEVFNAVAEQMMDQALAEIRERVAGPGTLGVKLGQVFEIWVVRGYELIHQAPDAKELIECTQEFSQDVIEKAYAEIEAILASVIGPYASSEEQSQQLARTLVASARGIKETARDVDDLRELLTGLVSMAVGTLSAAEAATA